MQYSPTKTLTCILQRALPLVSPVLSTFALHFDILLPATPPLNIPKYPKIATRTFQSLDDAPAADAAAPSDDAAKAKVFICNKYALECIHLCRCILNSCALSLVYTLLYAISFPSWQLAFTVNNCILLCNCWTCNAGYRKRLRRRRRTRLTRR